MKVKMIIWVTVIIMLSACSNAEAKERRDLPVQWATAIVQQDDEKMDSLLVEPFDDLDPSQGAQNGLQLGEYQLIEWKYDDETYFYEIVYFNERRGVKSSHQMEVVLTDDGWKKTRYGDSRRFKELADHLGEGEVLREMSE